MGDATRLEILRRHRAGEPPPQVVRRPLPYELDRLAVRHPEPPGGWPAFADVPRAAAWACDATPKYIRYTIASVRSFRAVAPGWHCVVHALPGSVESLRRELPGVEVIEHPAEDASPVPGCVEDFRSDPSSGWSVHIPTADIRIAMLRDNPPGRLLLYSDSDIIWRRSPESMARAFLASGMAIGIMPEQISDRNTPMHYHWRGDAWRRWFPRNPFWAGWTCANTGMVMVRGDEFRGTACQAMAAHRDMRDDVRFGEQSSLASALYDSGKPFFRILPDENCIDDDEPPGVVGRHFCGCYLKQRLDDEVLRIEGDAALPLPAGEAAPAEAMRAAPSVGLMDAASGLARAWLAFDESVRGRPHAS